MAEEQQQYENIFQKQELHDMYVSGEAVALDDLYLLEDVALTVANLDKEIYFYKDYKKKKKAILKMLLKF
jgi:hypothetical protein